MGVRAGSNVAPIASPTPPRTPSALEDTLVCPICHSPNLCLDPLPVCSKCGWLGRKTAGILDFVDDARLSQQHAAELEAQRHAVGEYYENEDKLSCHWDRLSAEDLPELLGGVKLGRLLDLGCGTGISGAVLKRAGAEVVGADLSMSCLEIAGRRLDAVVRTDAARLPFAAGSFDTLVARGALHHIADPRAALSEAHRVLKPGGRGLFIEPREFAWLEPIKELVRKSDHAFSEDHRAFGVEEYTHLIGEHFRIESQRTMHPFAIMIAVGLDLLPLPKLLPKRATASALLAIDRRLNRTIAGRAGHLMVVLARPR